MAEEEIDLGALNGVTPPPAPPVIVPEENDPFSLTLEEAEAASPIAAGSAAAQADEEDDAFSLSLEDVEPPDPEIEKKLDKSLFQEGKELAASIGEGLGNAAYNLYDAEAVGRGKGIDLGADSDDYGDAFATSVANSTAEIGITMLGAGAAAAGATALGVAAAPAILIGAAGYGAVTLAIGVQNLRRSLYNSEEEAEQLSQKEKGRGLTEDEKDTVQSRALGPALVGVGGDTILTAMSLGAWKYLKGPAKSAAAEVLKSEIVKKEVSRLGQIVKAMGVSGAGEGISENIEGAGQRAAVKSTVADESVLQGIARIPGEMFSKEGLKEAVIGSAVGATIRGSAETFKTRGAAKAAGGDIAAVNGDDGAAGPPPTAPPVDQQPEQQGPSDFEEGLNVIERTDTGKPLPSDQKALILNRVATTLEDVGNDKEEAILPPEFADTATIQAALRNQKHLKVEPQDDGSTKISHIPQIESDYITRLKERQSKRDGFNVQLKQVTTKITDIEERQAAAARKLDRAYSLQEQLTEERDALAEVGQDEEAVKLDEKIDALGKEIDTAVEKRDNNLADIENLAALKAEQRIFQANVDGLKLIAEAPEELDALDVELEEVRAKKLRLEDRVNRFDLRIQEKQASIDKLNTQLDPAADPAYTAKVTAAVAQQEAELITLENKRRKALDEQIPKRAELEIAEAKILDELGGKRFNIAEGVEKPGSTLRTIRSQQRALANRQAAADKEVGVKKDRAALARKQLEKLGANATPERRAFLENKVNTLEQEVVLARESAASARTAFAEVNKDLTAKASSLSTQVLQTNLNAVKAKRTALDTTLDNIDKSIENKKNQVARLQKQLRPVDPAAFETKQSAEAAPDSARADNLRFTIENLTTVVSQDEQAINDMLERGYAPDDPAVTGNQFRLESYKRQLAEAQQELAALTPIPAAAPAQQSSDAIEGEVVGLDLKDISPESRLLDPDYEDESQYYGFSSERTPIGQVDNDSLIFERDGLNRFLSLNSYELTKAEHARDLAAAKAEDVQRGDNKKTREEQELNRQESVKALIRQNRDRRDLVESELERRGVTRDSIDAEKVTTPRAALPAPEAAPAAVAKPVPPGRKASLLTAISERQGQLEELEARKKRFLAENGVELDSLRKSEAALNERMNLLLTDPTAGKLKEGIEQLSLGERLTTAASLKQAARTIQNDRAKFAHTNTPPHNTDVNKMSVKNPTAENLYATTDKAGISFEQTRKNKAEGAKRRASQRIKSWFRENALRERGVGMDIVNQYVENGYAKEATARKALDAVKRLKAVATPEEFVSEQVNQALAGNEISLNDMRPELRREIEKLRKAQDDLSDELIASGAVDTSVSAIISANREVYLNRNYKIFDSPAWLDDITKEHPLFKNALAIFRSQFPDDDLDLVEGKLWAFLHGAQEEGSLIGALQQAVKNPEGKGKALGILTKREQIPLALREIMGERTTAPENYIQSINKTAALISTHRMLSNILDIGIAGNLMGKEESAEKRFSVQISSEGSKVLEPLNGVWTTPEMKQAFEKMFASDTTSDAMKVLGFLTGVSKVNATVGSISGQTKNFLGNFGFMLANGYFIDAAISKEGRAAWREAWSGAKLAFGDVRNQNTNPEALYKYIRLGLTQGFDAAEVSKMFSDFNPDNPILTVIQNKINEYETIARTVRGGGKILGTVATKAQQLYKASDAFFKIMMFHLEGNRMRKDPQFNQLSPDEFDNAVARRVRDLLPTYETIPEGIQKLRRLPGIAPFISFHAEATRTYVATIKLAKEELQSENAETRNIGAKRMASILIAPLIPTAVAHMMNSAAGNDEEKMEALRTVQPPWDQNGSSVILYHKENGDPVYININSINPYGSITSAMTAGFLNDNLTMGEALAEATAEYFSPYIQEDLIVGRIYDVVRGTKASDGKPIVNPNDTNFGSAVARIAHILEPLVKPGSFRTFERIKEAAFDDEKSLPGELIGLTGIRPNVVNLERQAYFKGRDYVNGKNQTMQEFGKNLYGDKDISDAELKESFDRFMEIQARTNERMVRKVEALKVLKIDPDVIEGKLKEAKVGKDNIEKLMNGEPPPIKFSKDTIKKIQAIDGRSDQVLFALGIDIEDEDFSDNVDDE